MAAGSTYTPIATTTLGSAQSSYTFSSISGSYTDLVLVCSYQPTAGSVFFMQVGNGSVDTGSNYSQTILYGYTSPPNSTRYSNQTASNIGPEAISTPTTTWTNIITSFQNYSNTTTYKNWLSRYNDASGSEVNAKISLWRSTSAINTIKLYPNTGNFAAGSTFTLYGIAAA
jgi:hypothetical protein